MSNYDIFGILISMMFLPKKFFNEFTSYSLRPSSYKFIKLVFYLNSSNKVGYNLKIFSLVSKQ